MDPKKLEPHQSTEQIFQSTPTQVISLDPRLCYVAHWILIPLPRQNQGLLYCSTKEVDQFLLRGFEKVLHHHILSEYGLLEFLLS